MEYTKKLLNSSHFLELQREIRILERKRIYCKHEIDHLLDVCRIAWIMYLEKNLQKGIDIIEKEKDKIYLSGLLHDIGRVAQYQTGEHHAEAGVRIAGELLEEIGYPSTLQSEILQIISGHHGRGYPVEDTIASYICQADHLSRNCFLCEATGTCKWEENEKNRNVLY